MIGYQCHMRVFNGTDDLEAAIGEELEPSSWHTVTQDEVNMFADATGDHQWIHVDVEKAKDSPFGGTIAHGYLTLSLLPRFAYEMYRVDGLSAMLNYGSNKVRFPTPVPVGSRVRGRAEVAEVTRGEAMSQAVFRFTVELEGSAKPACIAETVTVLIPQ